MTNIEKLERDIEELNKMTVGPSLITNNMLKSIAISLAVIADKLTDGVDVYVRESEL